MEWMNWISLVILPAIGGLVWYVVNLSAKLQSSIELEDRKHAEMIKDCNDNTKDLSKQLDEFKLQVSKEYASNYRIEKLESKIEVLSKDFKDGIREVMDHIIAIQATVSKRKR